jgi:COMPASS component SWD3
VRLFDAAIGVEQRVLVGHELPVREAVFNPNGNLVVSGSKDATVRFWDVRSALCVRKLSHSLGEVRGRAAPWRWR